LGKLFFTVKKEGRTMLKYKIILLLNTAFFVVFYFASLTHEFPVTVLLLGICFSIVVVVFLGPRWIGAQNGLPKIILACIAILTIVLLALAEHFIWMSHPASFHSSGIHKFMFCFIPFLVADTVSVIFVPSTSKD
jgi:hypothetical protein